MKFLCLICAEKMMEQMSEADAEQHFQEYAEFTEAIRRSGHYVGCNRLLPPAARPRCGCARAISRPPTGPTPKPRSSSVATM